MFKAIPIRYPVQEEVGQVRTNCSHKQRSVHKWSRGSVWVPRGLTSYSMEMPQFKNDGLVVTEFLGRFCVGPSRTKPTSIKNLLPQ